MIGLIELTALAVVGFSAYKNLAPETYVAWAEAALQKKKHLPRIKCERCPKLIPLGHQHSWCGGPPMNCPSEDLCSDCHMILSYYTLNCEIFYTSGHYDVRPSADFKPDMMGENLWFCYGDL